MPYSPILVLHICGGTLGLLSGTAAISLRKGSRRHVLAGKVFVASMLIMALGAVYLGIVKHQPSNVSGGVFTFYLIGTAWLTARRRDGETGRLDSVALLIPLALGVLTWLSGISVVRRGASSQGGVPVGMIFFTGSVMLLAAAGDVRMLVRGGVLGAKAHRASSLAHVLWAVHRCRVLFPWRRESPTEIAFDRRARATPAPGFIQRRRIFSSHRTSTGSAGFLAGASSFHEYIQETRCGFCRQV